MSVRYEIYITNPRGARLAQISDRALLDDALWFTCTKTANQLGSLQMGLPSTFDRNLLVRDNMIQIWREPTGGRLSLFQAYFINDFEFTVSRTARATTVWGAGPNQILEWRRNAYFAGETQTVVTAKEADDAMKDLVRDNIVSVTAFQSGADTTARQWSTVTVQGDLTAGPQITKRYAWRNVLDILQDLSADSQSKGNQVWFDMVPILGLESIDFQFRTSTGQPGQDLTGQGVAFSIDKGTLSVASLRYDYTQEMTYIYALGQGQDSDRNVQTAQDDDRIKQSFYGRKEGVINATIEESDDGVQSEADAALFVGRPRIRFSAVTQDTDQFRFGRNWNWGDKVLARFENREFECIVSTVRLSMRNQEETVDARLEYEGNV